jgi:hypothetical protein
VRCRMATTFLGADGRLLVPPSLRGVRLMG